MAVFMCFSFILLFCFFAYFLCSVFLCQFVGACLAFEFVCFLFPEFLYLFISGLVDAQYIKRPCGRSVFRFVSNVFVS